LNVEVFRSYAASLAVTPGDRGDLKTLMALLWSIATRCEPCIRYYGYKASDLGVTEVELGEVCALATTMGACVAETWAGKAFAAAHERDAPPACSC
jgi:AhpD family alkylhydroperoxidase